MSHPYGFLSLVPPLTAIILAIATRRVVVSLLAGILAGALILTGGNPWTAVITAAENHLWPTLVDEEKLSVFAFTMLMGAMVGVIGRSGGMVGLVQAVTPWARDRRRGQLTTWALGLFVFFDDYANTILLGTTLRPLTDRLRISREKLAFLVDSTAAPVSGLALVSTWVAGEIGYVQDGLDRLPEGLDWRAFDLFLSSIPYRFYVLWMLIWVAMVAVMGRDFGPMRRAEEKRLRGESTDGAAAFEEKEDEASPNPQADPRWYNAVVPIVATVVAIVTLMYVSGKESLDADANPSLMEVFGEADAYKSLLWGSLIGLLLTIVWIWPQRLISLPEIRAAAALGARKMVPALIILWLASCMSTMAGNKPSEEDEQQQLLAEAARQAAVQPEASDEPLASDSPDDAGGEVDYAEAATAFPYRDYRLYTGEYLGDLLGGRIPGWLLPTLVFLLSSFVAFATGTSWGTMGILMPLVVPVAYQILGGSSGGELVVSEAVQANHPVLICSIGSVLAGAIFGDHCSPISDTTVLSSQACACDHVAHVWTQLPYALTVGGISIALGTLPIGLGVPVWLLLPAGIVAMFLVLRWWGREPRE